MHGSDLFQAGDRKVYDAFYREYKHRIYLFANNMLDNEAEAEDVSVDTFIKLWVKWNELDDQGNVVGLNGPGHVKSFLFKVARNHCFDILRTRKSRPVKDPTTDENLPADEINADRKMMRAEIIGELLAEIDNLPSERMKNVFLAKFTGPRKSAAEIARLLGIDEKAVYNDTYSAREYLRTSLLRKGFDPTWMLLIVSFSMIC